MDVALAVFVGYLGDSGQLLGGDGAAHTAQAQGEIVFLHLEHKAVRF